MPEYLHPGAYTEEVVSGPSPIEGASSSTTGFIGVTRRGPTSGKPVLVTSFGEFTRIFGGYWNEKELPTALLNRWGNDPNEGGHWWQAPLSVRGFFENGGARLYVKRVVAGGAVAARADFERGVKAEVQRVDGLRITLDHLIGARTGVALSFFDRRGNPIDAPGVSFSAIDPDSGVGTLSGAVTGLDRGGFVQLRSHQQGPGLALFAQSAGGWGNALRARIRPMYGASVNLAPFPDGRTSYASTIVAAEYMNNGNDEWLLTVADPGLQVGDHITARGETSQVSHAETIQGRHTIRVTGGTWVAGTRVALLRAAHEAGRAVLYVKGGTALYIGAHVEIGSARRLIYRVTAIDGDRIVLDAPLPAAAANGDAVAQMPRFLEGERLRVIEVGVDVRYDAGDGSAESETFSNLRLSDTDHPLSITQHLRLNSRLVGARMVGEIGATIDSFPDPRGGSAWVALTGGDDNLATLSTDDFVGQDGGSGNRTGIMSMEDVAEVALCAAPGMWSTSVHEALVHHAEALKDRFAILDCQVGLSISEVQTARSTLSTHYAALYYPWLDVRDPLKGESVPLAPSGHIAGLIARVDNERGVHKAPANEVIRGITGIAQDVNDREQDLLNPIGVNCLRTFPGRGHRVWGARTLTADPAWKYINVRRLFIFVESSVARATQWVVFEPNDEPLWARLRQSIGNFLGTLWRDGMLQGKTAEEAYFVRCDRSTMTPDDIDNGRLICLIGIAPVKPAEFVIFRYQQKTLDGQG